MSEDYIKLLIQANAKVPVYDDGMSITYPSATLEIYQDVAELHGEGKGTGRVKSCKIELWFGDKIARDAAQAAVLQALENEKGCTSPDVIAVFDTEARKYRSTLTFEFV